MAAASFYKPSVLSLGGLLDIHRRVCSWYADHPSVEPASSFILIFPLRAFGRPIEGVISFDLGEEIVEGGLHNLSNRILIRSRYPSDTRSHGFLLDDIGFDSWPICRTNLCFQAENIPILPSGKHGQPRFHD